MILKQFNNSIEECVSDNLLDDNLLDNDLLGDNSLAYIDSNIDINIEAKSNLDKNMTGNNLLEKNSKININDLLNKSKIRLHKKD